MSSDQVGLEDPKDLYELGVSFYEEGMWDEAVASLRKCLALNPRHPDAHCQLAHILCEQGLFRESEAEYREAIGLKASYLDAYKGLAECLIQQERYEEAKICWRKVLDYEKDTRERERIAHLLSQNE